ncbi:transmembrane protease serine 9-like [Contarinia nasturtii]|uniref:transmembrane protease serine 9-like n=1 Tax=Contarinia nasturtii TaxID=265458 RepID=UPI0012D41901|nr:transmembrane protease serine 9-like [Contarinia nasturtii]
MKMKVKRSQRQIALSLNTKSYSQLCFCIAYVILTICLLESMTHVDAYINGVTNVTNSFQHFNYHRVNNVSRRNNEHSNRIGRFLFDTLFGIDTPAFDAVDLDDDDDDDIDEAPKPCKCERKACGQSNQETRIVGGKPTGVNQYPWIARLVYDGNFHCGASLISKDYVLTAAHCVRRLKRSKIRIILGDHDQTVISDADAKMRAVSAVIKHRYFDSNTYNHDIALLKLRKPITYSKNIMPVCLPEDDFDPAGKTGIAVGWGRTSEGGALPSVVQHVEVPILSLNQCRNMKYRSSRITPNMVCAGKGKQDSCQGDSGGPLVVYNNGKYEVIGIVSWGVGCGRAGYPGVYTRVPRYMPWVRANVDGCNTFLTEFDERVRTREKKSQIMKVNYTKILFTLAYVVLFVTQIGAYSTSNGKGVYKTYNNAKKALTSFGATKKDSEKFLFGNMNDHSRAPSHDTPYTPCKCTCGERNDATRIVGGSSTGVNEFPWMARLSYFNRFYCGAALINDRYVLTAAHCVKGFMWFMIKVTFGEHDRCDDKNRPETRFVLRAISQPFSFSNFDNDVALLRLNDRVPITDFIRPICLPTRKSNTYVGTKAVATGWGTLKEDGKPSCILQEVEVPIMANNVCVENTNYTQKMITENMLCAGYPGVGKKDSCQGDSGGPLIAARPDKLYELVGVVSWGNGCARPNYPGVYTRVTQYLDWIRENSKDGCYCNN